MRATISPAGDLIIGELERLRRRWQVRTGIETASAGVVAICAVMAAGRASGAWRPALTTLVIVVVVTIVVAVVRARRWTLAATAARIEADRQDYHNVLITAEALLAGRHPATPRILERVCADAWRHLAANRPGDRVTLGRAWGLLALAMTAGAVVLWTTGGTPPLPSSNASRPGAPDVESSAAPDVRVTLTPPAHTRRPPSTVTNPDRLTAIEGTRMVAAVGGTILTATLNGRPLPSSSSGAHQEVTAVLTENGGLDIVVGRPAGEAMRRLIPVAIEPDRLPVVGIRSPARDLILDRLTSGIEVGIEAADDFGLRSLDLRYTKVTGSGEQFDFVEGDWPIRIVTESDTRWLARSSVDLSALNLEPGDVIAYRAVARDDRGLAGEASSDTYVVRIAQPGDVAAAGFAIDDDENRFALSQQMLLVKTQRLHAARPQLTPDVVSARSAALAAEQRTIRAEFVFLLGGHVEDETEEAEHSNELQEGRLQNRGQQDILAATRAMSRAERALTDAETTRALVFEGEAIEALQRAFSRARYLLRALPVRAQLDLDRRSSGDLSQASTWSRPPPESSAAARTKTLSTIADGLAQLASASGDAASARAARALALADALLRLDMPAGDLTGGAAALIDVARLLGETHEAEAMTALSVAYTSVRRAQWALTTPAPPAVTPAGAAALGALATELARAPSTSGSSRQAPR